MKSRPKIRPESEPIDKWIESIAWAVLIILWFWTLWNYADLPKIIPTHFDAGGQPDGYNNKKMIFTLPGIASLLFFMLTIYSRFPWLFNYPLEITQENAKAQYANATRMMRVLKLSMSLISLLICIQTIRTASGVSSGLGWWFMLVVLGLIVGPTAYFTGKSFSIKS